MQSVAGEGADHEVICRLRSKYINILTIFFAVEGVYIYFVWTAGPPQTGYERFPFLKTVCDSRNLYVAYVASQQYIFK